jgi:outer membrane protein assembly factor BamA
VNLLHTLRLRAFLAASLLVTPCVVVAAQSPAGVGRPILALHDSMDVATLEFEGAHAVSPDDLKRVVFTRSTSCRLVLIAPLCRFSASQLFNDRRRTTPAALGEDITKLRVYYWRRGFRHAQVDTVIAPARRGVAVSFRIV